MKIAIIGLSGRMSKEVINAITNRSDCEISGIFSSNAKSKSEHKIYDSLNKLANHSDAIIDFSTPKNSISCLKSLTNKKIVYVCGTTGFSEEEFTIFQEEAKKFICIWSPNMSIGINLLQKMIEEASKTLTEDFDVAVIDIHHKHKKDSPSGTALMLAKTIEKTRKIMPQISALRIGEVPGEHQVIFSNGNESIAITHNAFNRKIFAEGAIRACFWGVNKPQGLYSMQDVLK